MVPSAGGHCGANAVKRGSRRVEYLRRDSKHLHRLQVDSVSDGRENVKHLFRADVADQQRKRRLFAECLLGGVNPRRRRLFVAEYIRSAAQHAVNPESAFGLIRGQASWLFRPVAKRAWAQTEGGREGIRCDIDGSGEVAKHSGVDAGVEVADLIRARQAVDSFENGEAHGREISGSTAEYKWQIIREATGTALAGYAQAAPKKKAA